MIFLSFLGMSMILENGRRYTGEVDIHQIPNGKGTEFYQSGRILYRGNFENGKKNGYGTFFYETGIVGYKGQFKENYMEGQGLLYYQDTGNVLFNGTLHLGNFLKGNFYFENSTLSETIEK